MRKHVVSILKVVVPIAIIGWLLTAIEPGQWDDLRSRPKNWTLLGSAFGIALGAVCLSFVRWYLLVRSLEMKFSLADAFRLSFLGYLFNFISAGNVGGDLFKAYFIAREQPQRRTEAVATVIVDRLIGLYALLLVASAAILTSESRPPSTAYDAIAKVTLFATGCGGILLMLILIPGFTKGVVTRWLTRLPYVGKNCEQLVTSIRIYRDKRWLTAAIFGLSMVVHCLLALAMFMVGRALFDASPTLTEHMTIVPMSMVAGALPISPSGLGSFELAMDKLYRMVPVSASINATGLMVALVYRLMTIAIAAVGLVYYWLHRASVKDTMRMVMEPAVPCSP